MNICLVFHEATTITYYIQKSANCLQRKSFFYELQYLQEIASASNKNDVK